MLGPCVPSLSRPLLCVIGPPLAASPAVDAHTAVCTSSSSTPPHSLLYLDWSLEWVFGDRLSRVIDFVCDSPCVLGAVVLGADIQSAVYSLLSSRTCDGAPGTAACCVDGGCDCISTISRPCLALTTPPLHCTDVCRSPPTDCTSLLMSTGATSARAVGVLTKHKSGYVVSCPPPVLPDDAAWSDITTATFNRLLTCQATVDAMPAAPQLSTDTCSCAPTVPTGK